MKRTTLVTVCAAALMAGCGSNDQSDTRDDTADSTQAPTSESPTASESATAEDNLDPQAVAEDAIAALGAEDGFRVRGNVEEVEGIDLSVSDAGIAGSLANEGLTVDVVLVGGDGYVRAKAEFWREQAGVPEQALSVVADRWLQVPADNSLVSGFDDFTPEGFADEIGELSDAATVEESEFDGDPVYVVTDPGYGAMTVGQDSQLPLMVVGDDGQELRLTYDDVQPATAPSNARTLEQIQQELQGG